MRSEETTLAPISTSTSTTTSTTISQVASDDGLDSMAGPIDVEKLYEMSTTKRVPSAYQLDESVELAKWDEFKRKYGRVYSSPEEEQRRQEIFAGNLRFISAFNRQSRALFQLGVNKFADLTRNETNSLYIGPQIEWAAAAAADSAGDLSSSGSSPPSMRILTDSEQLHQQWGVQGPSELLRSADWRNLTADELVDQGQCKDSAVFAIIASIESTLNAATVSPTQDASGGSGSEGATLIGSTAGSNKIKLSEQQVLDCIAYNGPGPSAGWPEVCSGRLSMVQVFDFLQRQAIRLASAPEYAEFKLAQERGLVAPNSCLPPPGQQQASPEARPKVGSYDQVHRNNIDEALLNRGPLVVALDASLPTFHFYKSGIYHELGCSSGAYSLHALLVAYAPATGDGDTNLAHYTIRSSLGSAWGESGHMRLLKDAARNKCLPQNLATYPNIAYE